MVRESTLVCIHGYGVRGFFWEGFAAEARLRYRTVVCPDLALADADQAVAEIRDLCRAHSGGGPVDLAGHSLGAALALAAARGLDAAVLGRVLAIACPYGAERRRMPGWLRFALAHHLIPDGLIRGRFFGRRVPAAARKALFARAVVETPAVQALIAAPDWFLANLGQADPAHPTLVVASRADRIVPWQNGAALAAAMGAALHLIPEAEQVGHDDFGLSAEVAALVLDRFAAT